MTLFLECSLVWIFAKELNICIERIRWGWSFHVHYHAKHFRVLIILIIHLKFLKHILQLKSSTPSFMVYGNTGCFLIYVNVYSRMISYWAKLSSDCDNKIVNVLIIYKFLFIQYLNDTVNVKNPWFKFIHRF